MGTVERLTAASMSFLSATKGRDDFIRDAVEAFVRNRHEAIMPASEFEGLLRDAFTLLDKDNPVADASSASSGDAE